MEKDTAGNAKTPRDRDVVGFEKGTKRRENEEGRDQEPGKQDAHIEGKGEGKR